MSNRIALFFNYKVPYTLGHYVKSCLKQVADVDVLLPSQADNLKPDSHNLYFCVDDGSHHIFPQKLKPSAIWLVDTHTGYMARFIMARQFDYVFTAQKDASVKFQQIGINSKWIPLGCDPTLHGKKKVNKRFDIAFIGGDGWGKRKNLIQTLRKKFPNSYIGLADHKEIGGIYSQAKIVFNRSIINDLNMRVFEGLCSGSLLITNENVFGQSELFQSGKHLITYNKDEDAIPLIEYYLAHDEEREKIALCGMQEVLSKHTYLHRTLKIINTIENNVKKNYHLPAFVWIDKLGLHVVEFMYKIRFHFRNF